MTDKSQIQFLKEFCDKVANVLEYNLANKEIIFSKNSAHALKFILDNKINNTPRRQSVFIEKKNLPFKFFFNLDEFHREVSENDLEEDILILNDIEPIVFLKKNKETYLTFNEVNDNFLISNTAAFFKIKTFFEEKSHYKKGQFEFVDSYSSDTRTIILNSFAEKNRVVFEFPQAGSSIFEQSIDYLPKADEFLDSFESPDKHFHTFLKNSIIKNIAHAPGDKFVAFFNNIDNILNTARVNLSVYLHELSLEKIQNEYDEYKEKYFNEQTNVLSKISNQIIALPISIAGSAFAIFKLKESLFAVIFILVGLLVISAYMSLLVSIYWSDLKKILDRVNNDFIKLSGQPFFQEHQDELEGFTKTKDWLVRRASILGISLKAFFFIFWGLNVCLIYFGLYLIIQYDINLWLFFFVITTFLLVGALFNSVFSKDKTEETN